MKSTLVRWGVVALMIGTLAGCGGGGDGGTAAPAPAGGGAPGGGAAATTSIETAAAVAANDTATNPSAAFTVVQNAGVSPVTVNSAPKVNFTVISDGAVVTGLTTSNASFIISKLVRTNGTPDQWVSYTYRARTGAAGTQIQGYTDAAAAPTQLVYNAAGYYTYTFTADITNPAWENHPAKDNTWLGVNGTVFEPSRTHRVAFQLNYVNRAGKTVRVNPYFDFTIDANGNAVAVTDSAKTRKVVDVTSCNECHNKLAVHGGNRVDTQYCVTCHNAATTDHESGNVVDFRIMVHKIHAGEHLKEWFGQTYTVEDGDFSHVGFPQDLRNCTKCHDNTKAPQADNWKMVPNRAACGACHAGINFATGTGVTIEDAENGLTTSTYGHVGGVQTDDSVCGLCHTPAVLPVQHRTDIASIHNPTTAPGLVNFTYEIQSATVDGGNNLSVVFRINADGTPLTTLAPTGFTGGPGFLLAWALPQDGITTPADFTNETQPKGDAISVSISNLRAGTGGSISGPDASGFFTATLTGTAGTNVFPLGATMRTVALQSYWTQSAGTNGIAANTARHAFSVVKTVTGDTERRKVINPANCANCHEWLELHGGSRVIGTETTGLYVCAMCHVPNKASSGRGISDTTVNTYAAAGNFSARDLEILTQQGISTTFPVTVGSNWALQLPVTTNNFKDMIHGFHRGSGRVTPWQDARDRTGGTPKGATGAITLYDQRNFKFPGILNKCETCHLPDTWRSVPENALPSRDESIVTANTTTALALAALSTVNPADIVISPFAAVCFSCHDKALQKTHMGQNGGQIRVARSAFITPSVESCPLCHGPGKIADLAVVHNR